MTFAKKPLLTPLMRWFLLAMVLANIAGTMTNLLLPIYLTRLGASITQVGMVFTITSMVILVLQIAGGWVSDSIGRLRAIAIGSIGGVLGFLAMLAAPYLAVDAAGDLRTRSPLPWSGRVSAHSSPRTRPRKTAAKCTV